jgi:transcription initiation factor TFIIB
MRSASERVQLDPILSSKQQCPRCGKRNNFITDRFGGQVVCGDCGLVIEDRTEEVITTPIASRTHDNLMASSITKPDMGLATIIGSSNVDGSGRAIPGTLRPLLERLRMWDYRSQMHNQTNKNLKRAFGELEKLAEKVAVSEAVVEKAAYIYRKSIPLISTRGRSITTLIAASLYAACRSTQTPRTLKDIGEAANLDRLDIARNYRLLITENEMPQPVANPSKSISRIACGAGLSTKVQRRCLDILKRAELEGALAGNSPMGLAAASLYIASVLEGERSTKTHLAMVAGVTNVTIRNRCKVLISILGLDPELFDDTKVQRRTLAPSLTLPTITRQPWQ